jgi:hypothetical protein
MKGLVSEILVSSKCIVVHKWSQGGTQLKVHVEFHGTAAKVPSLKNAKLPGMNFINPKTIARLQAMDILYRDEVKHDRPTFADRPVSCIVILAEGSRCDEDNVFASVKDWLEPSTKQVGRKKKDRGWGSGLVYNDSQVIGECIRGSDIGWTQSYTTILVCERALTTECLKNYVGAHQL